MLTLTEEQIHDIAEDLECGFVCYFNPGTGEIKKIIDFDNHPYADEEMWKDVKKEINKDFKKLISFEPMSSSESFRVMEDFAGQIEDDKIRNELFRVLSWPKPFRHFKDVVDNSGEYREKWFEYKSQRYLERIQNRIDAINWEESQGDQL